MPDCLGLPSKDGPKNQHFTKYHSCSWGKFNFVRGKMFFNQGSECKSEWRSKPKKFRPEKAYFLGHPLIQAVEAKMLGLFYKMIIYLQNISSLKKSATFRIDKWGGGHNNVFDMKLMQNVIYPAPCLDYPHRLQGRLAALLVLYAYVIICRITNVHMYMYMAVYPKCTQFVSYIMYKSMYIIQLEYSSHLGFVYTQGEISLYLIGRSWLIPEGYFTKHFPLEKKGILKFGGW